MARVELQALNFSYPGAGSATLADLNMQVADGEAHALLGASGAGKTTLLNLLSGLLAPTSGRVLFDGEDVSAWPGRQRKVAQVFQFPVLYESMTVRENLEFPLRNAAFSRSDVRRRVKLVADELGVAGLLGQRAAGLSLFEKQLVAVAKALARPDVALVLLDEPLTAVAPKAKWRLRQVLRNAQADTGVTMVYVTHDQTEALTFADRVSVLSEQGILQTGTPQQIYESPAHEFVGHFVGSPGMNFVPAAVLGVAQQGRRLGFRPEWAVLDDGPGPPGAEASLHLRGTVTRVRPLGTRGNQPFGLTSVRTDHGEVTTRGVVSSSAGEQVSVAVRRYLLFENQQQVGAGGQR